VEREWIPISIDLHRRREVVIIASMMGVSCYEVVGRLVEFWGWLSIESADGTLPGVTIERLAAAQGWDKRFLEAMRSAGWLEETEDGLRIPNWERYMAQSAKHRSRMRRQAKLRTIQHNAPGHPSTNGTASSIADDAIDAAAKRIEEAWQEIPGLPAIRKWTPERRYMLAQRLADAGWLEDAIAAIRMFPECPFLTGKNDRGWRADIDWLLRPDSVAKILEGKYTKHREPI